MTSTFLLSRFSRRSVSSGHIVSSLALVFGLLQTTTLFAQEPTLTVSIQPATAAVGIPRTITVDAQFLPGCAPTSASLIPSTAFQNRVVTVQLAFPASLQPCTLVPVSHRYQVSYTPQSEEELRVLVNSNTGMYLGEGTLTTRNPTGHRSRFDLTGMWYDPATNGSGLTFVHAPKRNDSVFGTWYVYDSTGAPRWYTIQGVQWQSDGMVAVGTIFEASSPINTCALTLIACPTALAVVRTLGSARIEMLSATSARMSALDGNGSVLFVSNVIKAAF